MNSKLIFGIIIFFFLILSRFSVAEFEQKHKKADPVIFLSENNNINRVIDDVVKDFFSNNIIASPATRQSPLLNENISENQTDNSLNNSLDRQLKMTFSQKGVGAKFRILDKIYGVSHDLEILNHTETTYDSITIILNDCYSQRETSFSDALASLQIMDNSRPHAPFNGWISSKQSHLTNYNNYRYSLWLLSCKISTQE